MRLRNIRPTWHIGGFITEATTTAAIPSFGSSHSRKSSSGPLSPKRDGALSLPSRRRISYLPQTKYSSTHEQFRSAPRRICSISSTHFAGLLYNLRFARVPPQKAAPIDLQGCKWTQTSPCTEAPSARSLDTGAGKDAEICAMDIDTMADILSVTASHRLSRRPPACMLSASETRLLSALTARHFEGRGLIVDAGCGTGGSTVCLCDGLFQNAAIDRQRVWVHCFDRFIFDHPEYYRFLANGLPPPARNQTFIHHFFHNLGASRDLCMVHAGDFHAAVWDDTPIELLFVDIAKTRSLLCKVISLFFKRLIPGVSIIVHQDFDRPNLFWIIESVGYLLDFCQIVGGVVGASIVLKVQERIPDERITKLLHDDFTPVERLQNVRRALDTLRHRNTELPDADRRFRLTEAYIHLQHGDPDLALRIAGELKDDEYFVVHKDLHWMIDAVLRESGVRSAGLRE
jgi:hypothetical protein